MKNEEAIRREEEEANYFAMHLLVPTGLLAKEDLSSLDFADDRGIKELAKKYGVSLSVMAFRIREFLIEKEKTHA